MQQVVPISFTPEEKNEMEAAMEYLQYAKVNEENLIEIKTKLIATMDYRIELMKNPKTDIKESFPFFFASTDLVKSIFSWLLITINIEAYLFSLNSIGFLRFFWAV